MNDDIIRRACAIAEMSDEFTNSILVKLNQNKDIYEELLICLQSGNIEGKIKIQDFSVIDIFVWQINHFKANLDYAKPQVGTNKLEQVLCAYDTLLNMRENPEKVINEIKGSSGTDYPEKFI